MTEKHNHVFEDEFDDENNQMWDDELEITPNQNDKLKTKQSPNTTETLENLQDDEEKCWICASCDAINNLKCTIEEQDMKCASCKSTQYSVEMPIIMSSTWHDPKLYVVIEPDVFWECSLCTFHNDNMYTTCCEICEHKTAKIEPQTKGILKCSIISWECQVCKRENVENGTNRCAFCASSSNETPSNMNKVNAAVIELLSDGSDDEEYENEEVPALIWNDSRGAISNKKWRCPNCLFHSFGRFCCQKCFCRKPRRFNAWCFPMEYLVFGYCRHMMHLLNAHVPFVIMKLIEKFCPHEMYQKHDVFQSIHYSKTRAHNLRQHKSHNLKRFSCDAETSRYQLRGAFVATSDNAIYQWSFKITCNDTHCFVDKDDDKSLHEFIWKIRIGIESVSGDCTFAVGDLSTGPHFQSKSEYCRPFKNGDTVTMQLDMKKLVVSYAINDEYYGDFMHVYDTDYTSYVVVYNEGVTVDNVSLLQKVEEDSIPSVPYSLFNPEKMKNNENDQEAAAVIMEPEIYQSDIHMRAIKASYPFIRYDPFLNNQDTKHVQELKVEASETEKDEYRDCNEDELFYPISFGDDDDEIAETVTSETEKDEFHDCNTSIDKWTNDDVVNEDDEFYPFLFGDDDEEIVETVAIKTDENESAPALEQLKHNLDAIELYLQQNPL